MRTSEMIRQAIAERPRGAVFSSADFLSAGTRAAVDQALFRLMKAGTSVRVARGLYAAAGQQVDAQTVASALAHKTGERVGLAPAEGPGNVPVVPRLKAWSHLNKSWDSKSMRQRTWTTTFRST